MRVIITANIRYLAPKVVRLLRANIGKCELVGCDAGYFAHCLTIEFIESIARLRDRFSVMGFDNDCRNPAHYVRLKTLDGPWTAGRLEPELRWANRRYNGAAS